MTHCSTLGALMLDVEGHQLTQEECELLAHPMVGGVILFQRNFVSPDQLAELIRQIRVVNADLLIAVDQEGGRVVRFHTGFSPLHPMQYFGALYDEDPVQAFEQLRQQVLLMAGELQAVGVDFSFTPVLDLNWGMSSVIGDRSFHADPAVVTALGQVLIDALHAAHMPAVGKHFPGHGAIAADSHLERSEDPRPLATIEKHDLQPFKALSGILDGVMSAHLVYTDVDEMPASASSFWLTQVLRQQLGFSGLIFSDDLSMKGVEHLGTGSERVQKTLDAGTDMVLICNDRGMVNAVLDALPVRTLDAQRCSYFRRHMP